MNKMIPTEKSLVDNVMPGALAEALLTEIATWGDVTTILFAHSSIFEFKGPFPKGELQNGFYNLNGDTPGMHGHINLQSIDHIAFQDTPRRGRAAYALVFKTRTEEVIFKVFLGRDEQGEIFAPQEARFKELQQQYQQ